MLQVEVLIADWAWKSFWVVAIQDVEFVKSAKLTASLDLVNSNLSKLSIFIDVVIVI